MHGIILIVSVLLIIASSVNGQAAQTAQTAQMILKNADVYTMDDERSWADAVAISDGKIIYVGTVSGAEKLKGPETRVIDLKGKNGPSWISRFSCSSHQRRYGPYEVHSQRNPQPG